MELRSLCLQAFCLTEPEDKADAVLALPLPSGIKVNAAACLVCSEPAGRPQFPTLVAPQDVPKRSPFTLDGHCALMHAIAHIEFNAINLALDAVWRFPGLPVQFYLDWAGVAREEARHFTLVQHHLNSLGKKYGDYTAHEGLWSLCASTAHDPLARMALVPRTLEARGLDATPVIQDKLRRSNTAYAQDAVAILDVILAEEVGHVHLGNRWFHWLCQRDGVDPGSAFKRLSHIHRAPRPKRPLNLQARRMAGFTESELETLSKNAE